MNGRAKLLDWLRSDIMGPHTPPTNPCAKDILFEGNILDTNIVLSESIRFHQASKDVEEIFQFGRETPKSRYGVGVLYPASENKNKDQEIKKEQNRKEEEEENNHEEENLVANGEADEGISGPPDAEPDEYSITSENPFRPNQLGISFFVKNNCKLQIRFPKTRKVSWKTDEEKVNGRYFGNSHVQNTNGFNRQIYARFPIGNNETCYEYHCEIGQKQIPINIDGECSWLKFKVYCRKYEGNFLVTIILSNETKDDSINYHLFQSYFCVKALNTNGENMLLPYPGLEKISVRNDIEEDQLRLLYSNFENWGIGHGCSCGWDAELGKTPNEIFADVMPAVETPSMNTNVEVKGTTIKVSMKKLAGIDGNDDQLNDLLKEYKIWIDNKNTISLDKDLLVAAKKHLENCNIALNRMKNGLKILQTNSNARLAFRLANQSICLQQISTKKITSRKLFYNITTQKVEVESDKYFRYANDIYDSANFDNQTSIGYWRPFQIAFFLMSLQGITNPESGDRNVVDLIWFPTGGGKTEAYLGVAAFTMFYERLVGQNSGNHNENTKFGTIVFMRYTLRLLTTQQVQRAASMFCAMEYIRQNNVQYILNKKTKSESGIDLLGNKEFVLGLWAGKGVSANSRADAKNLIDSYRKRDNQKNNPLSLYRCPYCYAYINVYNHEENNEPPKNYKLGERNRKRDWYLESAKGPVEYRGSWWNRCPDPDCHFGGNKNVIPLQVVDESLYNDPPTMFIATVDKFAQLAIKKDAASLFKTPPSLIIQDELHLISGPLGSLYGLYETLVEKLCTSNDIRPKIICSTATIKGAKRQVKNLYGRNEFQLFPPPALEIEDSFFGKYAKRPDGTLDQGRLYVGINAHYSSALTTSVRVFSRIHQGSRHLFNDPENIELMDHYYTLVCFYNSIKELSGDKTLFDSDIFSRITSHLNVRDNTRNVKPPFKYPELTGRLSQNKLLQSLENLEKTYKQTKNEALDACLASSVIEVGVDIDRLALMAVVGQPKTTAQYIQVTGRVGRNWEKVPGLVFTLFSTSKPRDISHYEQFHSYHRRLYEYVEPTSVTPFSEATLERSLAAILFGWLVQNNKWNPDPDEKNCKTAWDEAKQFVINKGKILEIKNIEAIVGKLETTFKRIWLFKYNNRDQLRLHSWKWRNEDNFILFPYAEHAQCSEENLIRFMMSLRSVDMSAMVKIQKFDHDLKNLNPPIE